MLHNTDNIIFEFRLSSNIEPNTHIYCNSLSATLISGKSNWMGNFSVLFCFFQQIVCICKFITTFHPLLNRSNFQNITASPSPPLWSIPCLSLHLFCPLDFVQMEEKAAKTTNSGSLAQKMPDVSCDCMQSNCEFYWFYRYKINIVQLPRLCSTFTLVIVTYVPLLGQNSS